MNTLSDKCQRNECMFTKHNNIKNNGGTHCCMMCKQNSTHGPACQKKVYVLSMNDTFTNIYENKIWGSNNIKDYTGSSGGGSSVSFNKDTYIPFLKKFICDNSIKTIVDLGCGDFLCGSLLYNDLDIVYYGYDTYDKVIQYNSKHNIMPKYNFTNLDFFGLKEDIIGGDLCILKDVLQHWSLDHIYVFLDYITSNNKYKYILITNTCSNTKAAAKNNTDINVGQCRPLSANCYPLKKYNPKILYEYGLANNDQKEVSVIQCN